MLPHYHDTTNITGPALDRYEAAAESQENMILVYMRRNAEKAFTPEQIHRAIFDYKTPITSIRRAMSNLTRDGELIKTQNQVIGDYNRPVNTWQAVVTYQQLNLWSNQ